uniref:CRAL-TRIO domain-containing protein n=1 Tax=Ditylenchus dipsaci TaxID=166011 RepID=A0A915E305_9BILA
MTLVTCCYLEYNLRIAAAHQRNISSQDPFFNTATISSPLQNAVCRKLLSIRKLFSAGNRVVAKNADQHPSDWPPSVYSTNFNLLRWLYAYEGDVELAASKYRRHLRIRSILQLDFIEELSELDGMDVAADSFAPMTFLGEAGNGDHRVLLLEQSGKFDLLKIMQTIRTSAFMMNRFRLMERILREIRVSELRTGQMSSAVLIIDLQGLKFQPSLVGFISGPYRIMWGTLIEQYPYLISKILVINAPGFMNVLWNACCSFIPVEYRKKIHLLGENWAEKLGEHVALESLPTSYGGLRNIDVPAPSLCLPANVSAGQLLDETSLDTVTIPAGGTVVHTFYLKEHELLEFYMKHDQEFTMNIFFTSTKQTIKGQPSGEIKDELMEEVYAGCERPGLPSLDFWKWTVPYTGFYHVIFGNEKAWIMSVSIKYQIFQLHQNGSKVKVNPIPA